MRVLFNVLLMPDNPLLEIVLKKNPNMISSPLTELLRSEKKKKRDRRKGKNAFALLTVAGQKDDLAVANKSIVFDGFRIHLFEQGKFTPQVSIHEFT
jgi:hypothetical protein